MSTVLSTRRLNEGQRDLLLAAGLSLIQYDAIRTEPLAFDIPEISGPLIFTSGRGVDYFFAHPENDLKDLECYCVGEQTASKLQEKGQKVVEIAKNGQELSQKVVGLQEKRPFLYVSGLARLDVIPDQLRKNQIAFTELPVYKTDCTFTKFDRPFDAVLLFSPSGVRSYCEANAVKDTWLVCIGETTAAEARKFSKHVTVANATRIESVIAKAVKTIKL